MLSCISGHLTQLKLPAISQLAIGGGGGNIGKSINFGGGDGGDDNGDDDDYFDDFDEDDDGDEGGLFRRRMVLPEVGSLWKHNDKHIFFLL